MTLPPANKDKDAIAITLDPNFSTTRLVTREKPVINNDPSSKVQSVLFIPPNPERKGEGGLRTQGYFKRSYDKASGLSDNAPLPLVTIITVVFNGEKYLEQTIQSVINQTYDNVEYIVIDGGSTDGTIDIIRKYESKIDYWVSEPDEGIYDAMNKGIRASNGELIGILNSDDFYTLNAVMNILNIYQTKSDKHLIITGTMYRFDETKNIKIKCINNEKGFKKSINWVTYINHPAAFVAKIVYEVIGIFDTSYKIVGDYDLIFRAYNDSKINFIFTQDEITYMRLGGISGKFKTVITCLIECYLIRQRKIFILQNLAISFYFLLRQLSKHLLKMLFGDRVLAIASKKVHTNNFIL